MTITDTHTHLYSESFEEDREEVFRRAIENHVTRFFIPAIDSSYVQGMYELEAKFPEHIYLMAGLHPTSVKENYEQELDLVKKQVESRKFYGIGETGIDLYWEKDTLPIQQEAFRFQIRLAKQHELPVIIHCRAAFDEVFQVLEEERGTGLYGIFHCFTGSYEQAKQALSYNMKLGIGGVLTFKNGKIDQFLRQIPIEEIVLETDAPYLAPVPFRGKRNESAYIVQVLKKVSELYGLSVEEVAAITTRTSREIFKA